MIATPLIRTACIVALVLSGCSSTPVAELASNTDALPNIAAEFRTSIADSHERREIEWRMWRTPTRIVTENLSARTGEIWQRDGAATFMSKVFHDDRRAIEYQSDDLVLSRLESSWRRQSMLVDAQLLDRLAMVDSGWRRGFPYRRYRGKVDDVAWDITMRTDIGLPTRLVREHAGARQTTSLVDAAALTETSWSPTPSADYDIIEFADLGDRQADPFVIKVQDQIGKPHTH